MHKDYWQVELDSGGTHFSDTTYYSIVNGSQKTIVTHPNRELLQRVCDRHNITLLPNAERRSENV